MKGVMAYDEIRPTLKTGDYVLFWGKGLVSWVISKATKGPSHIARVIVEDGQVLIVESTSMSKLRDRWSGRRKSGVQAVRFSVRVATYPGRVAVRHLEQPLSEEQEAAFIARAYALRDKVYEESYWQLIRAAWHRWVQKPDTSSLFCSEFSAELDQEPTVGLLPSEWPSNELNPADTMPGRLMESLLLWNGLGPLIWVRKQERMAA